MTRKSKLSQDFNLKITQRIPVTDTNFMISIIVFLSYLVAIFFFPKFSLEAKLSFGEVMNEAQSINFAGANPPEMVMANTWLFHRNQIENEVLLTSGRVWQLDQNEENEIGSEVSMDFLQKIRTLIFCALKTSCDFLVHLTFNVPLTLNLRYDLIYDSWAIPFN